MFKICNIEFIMNKLYCTVHTIYFIRDFYIYFLPITVQSKDAIKSKLLVYFCIFSSLTNNDIVYENRIHNIK